MKSVWSMDLKVHKSRVSCVHRRFERGVGPDARGTIGLWNLEGPYAQTKGGKAEMQQSVITPQNVLSGSGYLEEDEGLGSLGLVCFEQGHHVCGGVRDLPDLALLSQAIGPARRTASPCGVQRRPETRQDG